MINLLFVHTDEKLSRLYSNKLAQHFKVHSAVDGLTAIRKIRQHHPRAVISDYHLPFLSGRALVKFVRSYPPTASSPFIFLSKSDFAPEALNLGANAWLVAADSSPEILVEQTFYLLKLR